MMDHVSADCECQGKLCRACNSIKCCSCFGYRGKYLRSYCRQCENAKNAKWRKENAEYDSQRKKKWNAENKDRIAKQHAHWRQKNDRTEYYKTYRLTNIEKVKAKDARINRGAKKFAYRKRRYYANPERFREISRNWQRNNLARHAANEQRRRALKASNGGSYTLAEWEELKRQYNFICLCCGRQEPEIKLTLDHVIPVTKGGTSNIDNIQPLCHSCNSSKNNRQIDYRVNWKQPK